MEVENSILSDARLPLTINPIDVFHRSCTQDDLMETMLSEDSLDENEYTYSPIDDSYNIDILEDSMPSSFMYTPLTSSGSTSDFDKSIFELYGEETSEETLYATYAELDSNRSRNLQLTISDSTQTNQAQEVPQEHVVKIRFDKLKSSYQHIILSKFTEEYDLSESDKIDRDIASHSNSELISDINLNYFGLCNLSEMKQSMCYKLPNGAKPINELSGYTNRSHKLETLNNDKYYSRINIKELSQILELNNFNINLTREIENNILKVFQVYCKFELGYKTWIRDTTKAERKELIAKLYSYTKHWYPELDIFKLEVIIRRGSYSIMQRRLRRERRINRGHS